MPGFLGFTCCLYRAECCTWTTFWVMFNTCVVGLVFEARKSRGLARVSWLMWGPLIAITLLFSLVYALVGVVIDLVILIMYEWSARTPAAMPRIIVADSLWLSRVRRSYPGCWLCCPPQRWGCYYYTAVPGSHRVPKPTLLRFSDENLWEALLLADTQLDSRERKSRSSSHSFFELCLTEEQIARANSRPEAPEAPAGAA